MRQSEKGIGRNLLVYGASAAVPGLAALASAPVFTRLLSKQSYSQYVLALAVIAAASALNSSVAMSVLRLFPAAEKEGQGHEFFLRGTRLAMLSGTGIAAVVAAAGALFGDGVGPRFGRLLMVAAGVFLCTELANVLLSYARITGRSFAYLAFRAWQTGAALIAGALLTVLLQRAPAGALAGSGVALLFGLPLLWRVVSRATREAHAATSAETFASGTGTTTSAIVAYGFPLMLAELAAWGLRLSDRWMLQAFSGPDAVAIYAAAYTLSEASILMVISVFQLALRPMEVRIWEHAGTADAKKFATESTRIFLLMALPVATLAWALARPLLRFAVPAAYLSGESLVPWVVFSGVLLGLQHRFQAGIVAARKTELISYAAAAGLAANVGLNLILVPRYGMVAAAVTTFIGYAVFLAGVATLSRGLLAWPFPKRSLAIGVLASACGFASARAVAVAAAALPAIWVLLLGGLAGLSVYVGLLLALGEVKPVALRNAFVRSTVPAEGGP